MISKIGHAKFSVRNLFLLFMVVFIISVGWIRVKQAEYDADVILRHNILDQANGISQTISPELVKTLSFTFDDKSSPAFIRIRQQMIAYANFMKLRSLYSMVSKNNIIYFGPENLDEKDQFASPPGTVYEKPTATLVSIFKQPNAVVVGPYTDEYGTFVSAFSPLFDPSSKKVLLVIGIDVPYEQWKSTIASAKLIALIPSISLLAVFLLIIGFLYWPNKRIACINSRLLRYESSVFVVFVGLSLTIFAATSTYYNTKQSMSNNFDLVVGAKVTDLVDRIGSFESSERKTLEFPLAFVNTIFSKNNKQNKLNIEILDISESDNHISLINISEQGSTLSNSQSLSAYSEIYPVFFAGRTYAVILWDESDSRISAPMQAGLVTFGYGTFLTGLLAAFVIIITRGRENLQTLVEKKTALLQESEGKYRDLFEKNKAIMFLIEPETGDIKLSNSAACDFYGWSNEEFLKKNIKEINTLSPEEVQAEMQDAVAENKKHFNFKHRLANGDVRDVEVFSTPVTEADKISLCSIVIDITEKVKARKTIEENKSKLESIIESLQAGLILIDADTHTIIEVNPAAAKLIGLSKEEIIGKVCHKFVCPAQKGECPIIDKGMTVDNSEKILLRHDGTKIPILKTVVKISLGERKCLLETFVDISVQKRTETALLESETNFRTFFETIDDIIVVGRLDGSLQYGNSATIKKLGYSLSEILSMHVLDLHPKDRREEAEQILGAMFAGKRDSCPLPLAKKDGQTILVETRIWHGKWDGSPCIFGVSKDLSLQQAALDKFQKMFDNNPALMALSTLPERKFISVNTSFLEKLGFNTEEVIGKTANELELFIEPDKQVSVAQDLTNSADMHSVEMKVRCKNGKILDGLFSGVVLEEQEQKYFLTVMVDISERNWAMRELKDTSTRLSLAARAGGVGVWDYDIINNVLVWDDQMLALYGIDSEHFSGAYQAWRSGLHPDDLEQGDREINWAISGTKEFDTEFRVVWLDGSVHDIKALAVVQRDENGKALRMIGTNWDITGHKQAEKKLKETNHQLELANTAKSEFLSNMSHEIRTPMNGVIGMSQLLLGTVLDPTQQHYVETICSSGESLLFLINDILDYSKIEANKLNLETTDFDLRNLLDDCSFSLAIPAHKKGLEFICTVDSDVQTYVCGDPHRLQQILYNFVGNAIKFTSKGEVVVKVSLVTETEQNVLLRFSVRDTGIGISTDRIRLLFQKFSQVDASTTRNYGGSGLGLAICKQLAEMMGGTVGVESQKDKGSEFWFTVLLLKQKLDHAPNVVSIKVAAKNIFAADNNAVNRKMFDSALRILLVEDNETNQEIALGILDKFGLHPEVVPNGIEALKALTTSSYDLVLMDIQMPEMDGYEATLQIRSLQSGVKNHKIPIIAMTANALKEDQQKCFDVGMDDYIAKPIDITHMIKILRKWLKVELSDTQVTEAQVAEIAIHLPNGDLDAKIFDLQSLLTRVQGSQKIALRVTEVFLKDSQVKLEELKSYVLAGNAKSAEIVVHAIKGAASNVGGEEVRALAYEMENAAKAGDLVKVAGSMNDLQTMLHVLHEEIKKWSKI